jgi:hypothetical protein
METSKENDRYFPVFCPICGWEGKSNQAEGGHAITDTGDYEDIVCPQCFSHRKWNPLEESGSVRCDNCKNCEICSDAEKKATDIGKCDRFVFDSKWDKDIINEYIDKFLLLEEKPSLFPRTVIRKTLEEFLKKARRH